MNEFSDFIKDNEDYIIDEIKNNIDGSCEIDCLFLCDNVIKRFLRNIIGVIEEAIKFSIGSRKFYGVIDYYVKERLANRIEQGISLGGYVALLKYFKISIKKSINELYLDEALEKQHSDFIDSFFDCFDVLLTNHWCKLNCNEINKSLRDGNVKLLNEKNRYIHIFEQFPNPTFIVDGLYKLLNTNYAADELFYNCDFDTTVYNKEKDEIIWIKEEISYFIKGSYSEISFIKEIQTIYDLLTFKVKLKRLDFKSNDLGILVILEDITHSKKLSEEFERSEKNLREITDNINDMIFKTDIYGKIKYISPSVKSTLGYKLSDLIDESIFIRIHENDVNRIKNMCNKFLKNEKIPNIKCRYKKYDGQYIFVDANASFLYSTDGKVSGVIMTIRDVTSKKKI